MSTLRCLALLFRELSINSAGHDFKFRDAVNPGRKGRESSLFKSNDQFSFGSRNPLNPINLWLDPLPKILAGMSVINGLPPWRGRPDCGRQWRLATSHIDIPSNQDQFEHSIRLAPRRCINQQTRRPLHMFPWTKGRSWVCKYTLGL